MDPADTVKLSAEEIERINVELMQEYILTLQNPEQGEEDHGAQNHPADESCCAGQ